MLESPKFAITFPIPELSSLLLVLGLSGLSAITQPASASDFSEAFERLRDLGLPDVRGATYGRLEPKAEPGDWQAQQRLQHFPEIYEFETVGNGWRLPGGSNEKGFTVVVSLTDSDLYAAPGSDSSAAVGAWREVDIDDDLAKVMGYIEKEDIARQISYRERTFARILLFAAHIDRNDQEAEAEKIVRNVLGAAENPESLITEAISLVADARYQRALHVAFEQGDWAGFAATCRDLAEKFGRSWTNREAALALAEEADRQAGTSSGVALPEDASPEMARAVEDLGSLRNLDNFSYVSWLGPWLLASEEKLSQLRQTIARGGQDSTPLLHFLESGRESIPVLVALLEDGRYLPVMRPRTEIPADEIDRILGEDRSGRSNQSFQRPATRAQVSAALLAPLIPGLEAKSVSMEDFRKIASDWWEDAEGASPLELAREYLRGGGRNQTTAAIEYLSSHGTEQDFEHLEKMLLRDITSSSSPMGNTQSILTYVTHRGEAAAPFVGRVEEEIQEYLERTRESDPDNYEYQKENLNRSLSRIEGLISSETAEEMLARVVSGEAEYSELAQPIVKKLAKHDLNTQAGIVLDATASADDPQLQHSLSTLLYHLEHDESTPFRPGDHSEVIESLLDSERMVNPNTPLRAQIAWMVEVLADRESESTLQTFWSRAGINATDLLVERTRARLAGSESEEALPAFPDPDDVGEDRRESLEAELLALASQPDALREKLDSLTMAETFWAIGEPVHPSELGQAENEAADSSDLREAIESVQFETRIEDPPAGWEGLSEWRGSPFTIDRFDELIAMGLEKVAGDGSFRIRLERPAGFGPLRILVSEPEPDALQKSERVRSAVETVISMSPEGQPFVGLAFGEAGFMAYWFPETKSEEEEEADAAPDPFGGYFEMEMLQKRAEQARQIMESLLQAPAGYSRNLSVTLLGTTARETSESDPTETETDSPTDDQP